MILDLSLNSTTSMSMGVSVPLVKLMRTAAQQTLTFSIVFACCSPSLPLWSVVFHVWGKLNKTFDTNPQDAGLLDYFDQYVKWDDPAKPPALQVYMDSPGLVQGFYNLYIEGSLSTQFPDIVNLFGLDQFDDGTAKYMGNSLRNSSNKAVPIQTIRSKVGEFDGPTTPIGAGESAAFTWTTQGYGEQFCYVDGQKIANAADRVHCESPISLKVADTRDHTLQVVLADVCGDMVANGIVFNQKGWRLDGRYQPPPPPPLPADAPVAAVAEAPATPLIRRQPVVRNTTTTSAAGSVLPNWLATAAATGLAVAAAIL